VNTKAPSIPAKEQLILDLIRRRGWLSTRIEELSDGDHEYLEAPDEVGQEIAIADDDVLTCLHSLEGRGLIVCTMHVHLRSATEYICQWKPVTAGA
jgi:hypothetical protein